VAKSAVQQAKEETGKKKRLQPTAVYRCTSCNLERRVRGDLAPVELRCLHCDRRVRPKVIRELK